MTHYEKLWSEAVNHFRVGQAYAGYNSGLVQIDWDRKDPVINFQTITPKGEIVLNHTINKSKLAV